MMSAKKNKDSVFWIGYSDLMTSLFFVMLLLFVAMALQNRGNESKKELEVENKKLKEKLEVSEEEARKIKELQAATMYLDQKFFEYSPQYKKSILKTRVKFQVGSHDINDLDDDTREELHAAFESIEKTLRKMAKDFPDASFLLIIEGQASKDNYPLNDQLSYDRALELFKFWFPGSNTLSFKNLPCEIVIAGAGMKEGKPKAPKNSDNQRFLIQIIAKPGKIDE